MVRIQRSAWAFAFGVRTGVTSTSAPSAEHVVEPATELCVAISNEEPYPLATLVQHQE